MTCKPLLKSTLQAWAKEIPLHELSQTFRDAIVIARYLEIRYLWIDAFALSKMMPKTGAEKLPR